MPEGNKVTWSKRWSKRCAVASAPHEMEAASGSSEKKCFTCAEFEDHFRQAFATSVSSLERFRLLMMLPSSLTKNEVQKIIPEASMYGSTSPVSYKEKHSVWCQPDPYTGYRVITDCMSVAPEHFTKYEPEGSRQSPSKKDTISVVHVAARKLL